MKKGLLICTGYCLDKEGQSICKRTITSWWPYKIFYMKRCSTPSRQRPPPQNSPFSWVIWSTSSLCVQCVSIWGICMKGWWVLNANVVSAYSTLHLWAVGLMVQLHDRDCGSHGAALWLSSWHPQCSYGSVSAVVQLQHWALWSLGQLLVCPSAQLHPRDRDTKAVLFPLCFSQNLQTPSLIQFALVERVENNMVFVILLSSWTGKRKRNFLKTKHDVLLVDMDL